MTIRAYDHARDRDAALRIWTETGWLGGDDDKKAFDIAIPACRGWIGELGDSPECFVVNTTGKVLHGNADLPMSVVAGVTTGYPARRQGLAGRVTSHAIATDVADGAVISGLGIFEQGFYDKLGFGTCAETLSYSFDPRSLSLPADTQFRAPTRLTPDDHGAAIHANRLTRRRMHGSVNLDRPELTHADLLWDGPTFGLGYFDGPDGALSHHICFGVDDREFGPYNVTSLGYQTREQFNELLAATRALGDQVRSVRMWQPPGITMQAYIERPFAQRRVTKGNAHESYAKAFAWCQLRMCDVEACLSQTSTGGDQVRFNLVLTDPIEQCLPPDAPWRGVGGAYVVEIGTTCGAERGNDDTLPTLRCSVNTFTRLWMAAAPATTLAYTDSMEAPFELLNALESAVRLPAPIVDWPF